MHFSTLALLIALPAAAYAAVYPQQLSVRQDPGCISIHEECGEYFYSDCCEGTRCHIPPLSETGVCPSTYALPLTDRDVSIADNKSATFSF